MDFLYYFLDPAFLCTTNIEEYRNQKLFEKFISYYNRIREIESKLFFEGNKDSIFKIPYKMEIINDCLLYPPSMDPNLSKPFYKTFNIFLGRYISECNKSNDVSYDGSNGRYSNSYIPRLVESKFDTFLKLCSYTRNSECNCTNIMSPTPIFSSINSNFLQIASFIPFNNPDDIFQHIPLLNLFPLHNEAISIKERKLKLILEINIIKKGIDFITIIHNFNRDQIDENRLLDDPLNNILDFQSNFWESDFLYLNDDNIKNQIVDVLTDLLIQPDSLRSRKHILNEYIELDGRRKKLIQVDIFQRYNLDGRRIFPRLRYIIANNKLYLIDIINRH